VTLSLWHKSSINFFEISILKVIYDEYMLYVPCILPCVFKIDILRIRCYDYLKIQDLNCNTVKRILRQFKPKTFLVIRFSSIFLFTVLDSWFLFNRWYNYSPASVACCNRRRIHSFQLIAMSVYNFRFLSRSLISLILTRLIKSSRNIIDRWYHTKVVLLLLLRVLFPKI